jgi:hypothetical protein
MRRQMVDTAKDLAKTQIQAQVQLHNKEKPSTKGEK